MSRRLRRRIIVEHRRLGHVALDQANTTAIFQINGRVEIHARDDDHVILAVDQFLPVKFCRANFDAVLRRQLDFM